MSYGKIQSSTPILLYKEFYLSYFWTITKVNQIPINKKGTYFNNGKMFLGKILKYFKKLHGKKVNDKFFLETDKEIKNSIITIHL